MALKRVLSGNLDSKTAYQVEYTDKVLTLDKTSLLTVDLAKEAVKSDVPIFLHKNRNGTVAVATGQEPKVWPEDEIIKEDIK